MTMPTTPLNALQTDSNAAINHPRTLTAACSNGVAGVLIFSVLPVLLGTFSEHLQLSDQQLGLLGSVYFGCYALIALSSAAWIRTAKWRASSSLGIVAMLGGLGTCLIINSYYGALAGLALAGVGAAITHSIGFSVVAHRKEKDRDYAIKLIPEQLVPGLLLVITATFFISLLSLLPFLILLAAILSICFVLSRWLPSNPEESRTHHDSTDKLSPARLIMGISALIALGLYFMGFAGLWAFLERIGSEGAMSQDTVSQLLALGLVSSALGPLAAAYVNDRIGRALPVILACTGTLAPLFLFGLEISRFNFALIMLILPFMYYFGIAYFLGIIADIDPHGRLAGLIPFALAVGAAIGPYVFAILKSTGQADNQGIYTAYGFVAMVIVLGCTILLTINHRLQKKTVKQTNFVTTQH